MADEQSNTVAGKSVMIALLPTSSEWCKIKLPHMTLVYAGEIEEDLQLTDFNVLAKDACSLAQMTNPFSLKVTGTDTFGEEPEQVDVLTLELTTQLRAMRHFVEDWNESEFTEFKPHCTIGPAGTFLEFPPLFLHFDRIAVGWGDDLLTFNLKAF
jgi:2'-5' RNA ligase